MIELRADYWSGLRPNFIFSVDRWQLMSALAVAALRAPSTARVSNYVPMIGVHVRLTGGAGGGNQIE